MSKSVCGYGFNIVWQVAKCWLHGEYDTSGKESTKHNEMPIIGFYIVSRDLKYLMLAYKL